MNSCAVTDECLALAHAASHPGAMFTTADEAARAWRSARDEAAARWLTERLWPLLASIALRYKPRGIDVEDLVQESLARAFTRIERWTPGRSFEAWICRITTNVCIDALRRLKRRPEWNFEDFTYEEAIALHEAYVEVPDDPDAFAGAPGLLAKLLSNLKPVDRVIITLLHLEAKSVAEISELTGVTRLMVRVRAHRARAKLRKIMDELEHCSPL
jgi:RNA polymerase sigma-70 factor (ECF subfamily)